MKKEPYPQYKKHRKNNSKYYYHDRVPYGSEKDVMEGRVVGGCLIIVAGVIAGLIFLLIKFLR